ncbi:hypothetical protein JMUB6875_50500 [Nocardia sp. JMUB6875]|uniref:DUF5685 family protein n=1 Tax=Nocardia sp. JMUB6875 TaxID=3158170 RepID=UPI0032E6B6B3
MKVFGLLRPCAHGAARHGIDPSAWQTHMCGLCLGLRDGHGQMARAATNTDAIVLEVLTEAQQSQPSARTTAGPCPLRGMRRASVVAADAPGVRLAATASLLLGAAKIRDHIDDGDAHRLARRPLARVSTRWDARARAAAAPLGLDVEPLIAAIESQLRLENSPDSTLEELTEPTRLCAAELFAHTAMLADRPENADALREAGWHFGRIAHLADALEDLDADRAAGRFNPLTATGTTPEEAHALVAESNSLLRAALARVALDRAATVRWMLLDPLTGVVRKLGRAAGIAHTCATGSCRTRATDGRAATAGADFTPLPELVLLDTDKSSPVRKPGLLEGLGIIGSQYCTGYACCAAHTRPCSGERKDPWINRCDCDCNPCDCCDCGDCDCCDCDCCGCDCGC